MDLALKSLPAATFVQHAAQRPREASGTKWHEGNAQRRAELSVLDGWWIEGWS